MTVAEPVGPVELDEDLTALVELSRKRDAPGERIVIETPTGYGHIITNTSLSVDKDGYAVLVLEVDHGMPKQVV